MMRIPFMQAIQCGRVLLSDGAWDTFLQAEGLKAGESPESWNLLRPEIVKKIAESYIAAGSDMIETNTFGGCRYNLRQYGLAEKSYELNKAGALLSRQAAGDEHWVLGSVGPSGTILMTGEIAEDALYEDFLVQMTGLIDGGVDAICLETFSALDEAELAIQAARVTGLPLICTFTFEKGFSMMGVTPEAYVEKMMELGIDVLGTNCGNGLEGMRDIVKRIRTVAPGYPVLVHANAGLPKLQGTEMFYPETPEAMAAALPDIIAAGATLVGGCCGTTPEHIRAMKNVLGNKYGRTQ